MLGLFSGWSFCVLIILTPCGSWSSIGACFPMRCLVFAFPHCNDDVLFLNRFGPSGLLHETQWKVGIISFGSTRLPEGFKPIWHFAADVAWEWSKIKRCLLGSSWFRVDLCDGKSVVELLDCGAFLFTLYQTNIAMERNIPILNGKYIFIFKCQTVGFPLSCQFFGVNSISKLPGTPAIETADTSWYQMVWRSNDSVWRVFNLMKDIAVYPISTLWSGTCPGSG